MAFKDFGRHPKWPKVADVVIEAGKAYYFLGWTAFQIENFEKGIFYFDQAISEDIRKSTSKDIQVLKGNPAIGLFLLEAITQAGFSIANELPDTLIDEFNKFSKATSFDLNKNNFVDVFVAKNLLNNEFRTIVTSIYSFIIEYKSLEKQLKLRSVSGGSLEPFFLHLFKGGLILESLLKLKSPSNTETLRKAISRNKTRLQVDMEKLPRGTLEVVVSHFNSLQSNKEAYQNICFAATYGIRNTTGHNLVWADIFQNDQFLYGKLYTSIIGSIFWTIYKLWIE